MKTQYQYIIDVIWSDEDQLYIAEVPELEGCLTHGKTAEQAVKNAHSAIKSWILAATKLKHPVPEPVVNHPVSGKFNVRLPKQIHRSLIIKAAQERVSLNQMVLTLLTKALA